MSDKKKDACSGNCDDCKSKVEEKAGQKTPEANVSYDVMVATNQRDKANKQLYAAIANTLGPNYTALLIISPKAETLVEDQALVEEHVLLGDDRPDIVLNRLVNAVNSIHEICEASGEGDCEHCAFNAQNQLQVQEEREVDEELMMSLSDPKTLIQ